MHLVLLVADELEVPYAGWLTLGFFSFHRALFS
jgi:hypothetical protein